MMLRKIISGGQTGADQAGLVVATRFGLETGGIMPKGHKTLTGPRPDLAAKYGLKEHSSDNYVPRTYENVRASDGTVRLAGNLLSRGEVCTLKAINTYNKFYFDVDLTDPPAVKTFCQWLQEHKIQVLNVAGNAEQTFSGAYQKSASYLTEAFFMLGLDMTVSREELYQVLGIGNDKTVYANKQAVDGLVICRSDLIKDFVAPHNMENCHE